MSLWTAFENFLCCGKKEKDFWKTETWRKTHNEKRKIDDILFDFLGPAGIIILILFLYAVMFFSRDELTAEAVRRYNFLNIKTSDCPVEEIYKAQIGIEEHHSKNSTSYHCFIKIYIGEKSYKFDTFQNYDILQFYDDYISQLGPERLTVTGNKYTEKYLNRKPGWSEEKRKNFRDLMNKEKN